MISAVAACKRLQAAISRAAFYEEHVAILNEPEPVPVVYRGCKCRVGLFEAFIRLSQAGDNFSITPARAILYADWIADGGVGTYDDFRRLSVQAIVTGEERRRA